MKFKFPIILLNINKAFRNWNIHPQIAQVTSTLHGLDVNCLGSFISNEHVLTNGNCIQNDLRVKAYKTALYAAPEPIGFYKVENIVYITDPPLVNSNSSFIF